MISPVVTKKIIHPSLSRWTEIACVLVFALLAGCGGGGSDSGGSTPAAPAAVFDLAAAQDNIYNNSRFNLTGDDNLGGHYTASMIFTNQGTQTVNGIDATHITLDLSLTETNSNAVVAGTQDLYFEADYVPVLQVSNPDNIQYMPTSVVAIPSSASVGDSGAMATYALSTGEIEVDTWSLDPGVNGRATLTFHVTIRDATNAITDQETYAFTIDEAGTVYALALTLNDSSGLVLTLSGNKQ